MNAAKTGSPEGVRMLLEAGADPNKVNSDGMTALAYGIISGNVDVINMLAPVTTAGDDQVIIRLAQSSINIEGEVEKYLDKIKDKEKLQLLLDKASSFGNEKLLDYLLNTLHHDWSTHQLNKALENTIKSEKVDAVKTIFEYFKSTKLSISARTRKLMKKRG